MALADEKYILLTTFRRDGTPVATPVWVVALDGDRVGFWTSSGSGKAKRLAHTQRVTVTPCDGRGRVKSGVATVDATARMVTGAEFETIRERVLAKYGVMTKVTKLLGTIVGAARGKRIPYGDTGRRVMADRRAVAAGTSWESIVGYSRAVRVGRWVAVAGRPRWSRCAG